jgi:hypothetical protein
MTTEKAAPTITARKAKHEDASNIFRLLKADSEQGSEPFDPDNVLSWIAGLLREGVVYVADLSGRVVGVLGMEVDGSTETVRIISVLRGFGEAGVREFLIKHAVTLSGKSGRSFRIVVADSDGDVALAVAAVDLPVYGTVYQTDVVAIPAE